MHDAFENIYRISSVEKGGDIIEIGTKRLPSIGVGKGSDAEGAMENMQPVTFLGSMTYRLFLRCIGDINLWKFKIRSRD
jgi:hypothetical protein